MYNGSTIAKKNEGHINKINKVLHYFNYLLILFYFSKKRRDVKYTFTNKYLTYFTIFCFDSSIKKLKDLISQ